MGRYFNSLDLAYSQRSLADPIRYGRLGFELLKSGGLAAGLLCLSC